jgi:hypothetical protein
VTSSLVVLDQEVEQKLGGFFHYRVRSAELAIAAVIICSTDGGEPPPPIGQIPHAVRGVVEPHRR